MATYVPAKRATELIFYLGLVSQSTGQFQENPTLAAGDVKVSKDGGALANLSTLPAVTPAASKMVKVTLSATEMTADNVTLVFSDAAGAEWDDVIINIQTAARQIDDLAHPTTSGRSIDVTAGGEVGIDWANIGSPTTTVNLSGTTVKTATDVETDTADIQTRLPAALVSGRMDSNMQAAANGVITAAVIADAAIDAATFASGAITADAIAADAIGSSELAASAVTEIQSGLSTLDAAGVRSAVGLASANLDTQLSGIQADTDNIQTRLPAALSGDGFMKSDLLSINDQLTNDYNATLKLRQLDIQSSSGPAISAVAGGAFGAGIYAQGASSGIGAGIEAAGEEGGAGIRAYSQSGDGNGIEIEGTGTGKSIVALQDIALPSGDLDDQLQAIDNLIDTEVAAIKAKTDQLTFTVANQVDANIQAVNDTNLTGNGSTTPWGPA